MIRLSQKTDCCGCTACEQSCPKHCISMNADAEGFLYPSIDLKLCIDCGLCERVCPVINRNKPDTPEYCIAAINRNEDIRFQSSSGGIFTLLAEQIIKNGGIVFGAVFDNDWNVIHSSAETIEQIAPMRGSKYVQSELGNTFSRIKDELKKGRPVLFTGTQCQVSGLNHYIGNSNSKLITVEVICHGAPSPATWHSYRPEIKRNVRFRDKRNGWSSCGISFDSKFTPYKDDSFLQSFFCKINMRPSCYVCPAKSGRSGADITLGDFWGIQNVAPEFYDNIGTSLIIVHTNKGQTLINSLDFKFSKLPYNQGLSGNPSLAQSVEPGVNRNFFFNQFKKHGFDIAWGRTISQKRLLRMWRRIFSLFFSDSNFKL